jgi:DNA-binding response OmpR family regulator
MAVMKVHLKIMGDTLYSALTAALKPDALTTNVLRARDDIEWQISAIEHQFVAPEWVCAQNTPTVLIIDGDDPLHLRSLQSAQGALHSLVNIHQHPAIVRCPVLLMFSSSATLAQCKNMPEFASDWMCAGNLSAELLPRVLGAMKKAHVLPSPQHHAALTLIPGTRTMIYDDTSARLTPAEYTLLELFLSNVGSIISLQELVQTFQSSGKSAEPNNIRVAIYQLRLKLDTLTKSQMPLTSIYRQGYCLRQKLKPKTAPMQLLSIGNRHGAQSSA